MNKPNVENAKSQVARIYSIVKLVVIAILIGLAAVGSYVISQPALRNQTIDYAQGQGKAQ